MCDLDARGIYVVNPDIWRGNITPSIAVREKVTMEVSDSSYQNDNDQLPLKTLVIEGANRHRRYWGLNSTEALQP